MNITWVLASNITLDATQNLKAMKNLGSFWGSWRTWKNYATDNVVCHDRKQARKLLDTKFNTQCNFYIPNADAELLGRPDGVRLYEGSFSGFDIDNQDDIVAMNLAATVSDVVLLIGFNFTKQEPHADKLIETKNYNYRNLVKQVIVKNSNIQWVIVNHTGELITELTNLDNVQFDTLSNMLS